MSDSLLVSRGRDKGKRYLLSGGEFLIGRDSDNDVLVPDIEVSRRHCSITRAGDDLYYISDLSSSNGTFVNGNRVTRCRLRSRDRIRIGSTEIIFQQEPESGVTKIQLSEQQDAERAEAADFHHNGDSPATVSALAEDTTYYDVTVDDIEASRRFVQVGNDLRFIYHASLTTSRQTDCSGMLKELLDLVFNWIAADRGCVFLRNENGSGYHREVIKFRNQARENFQVSKTIIQYVHDQKVGVLSSEASSDQRWGTQPSILQMNVGEVMCVPIQGRQDILGLIYLDTVQLSGDTEQNRRFSEDHLKLLVAMAHQTAVAIENEAYYQALVEKERLAAIGETTNVIAHHVKNTIQGINGGAHLIESGIKLQDLEVIEKGWQIVNRNQEQISRLVIDMLLLGRPYDPNLETADLNAAIAGALDKLAFQLAHQGTVCEFNANQSVSRFKFDFAGISSTVFHMVNCSLLACRDSSQARISVSTAEQNGFAEITIEDNGTAIDIGAEEDGIELFGEGPDLKMYGIGWAVSRKIVGGHNGDLQLSHPGGKGNRFVIKIPMGARV